MAIVKPNTGARRESFIAPPLSKETLQAHCQHNTGPAYAHFLASASLCLYTLENAEVRNCTSVIKLLFKFLCRTKEKKQNQLHIPDKHTYMHLISNSRQAFHSQFLGVLCEYILSLTGFYVEYVNHVMHKAAYHSLSRATKWWNKHIGAPDHLQAPSSNLWRLMTKVMPFSSSVITSDTQDAPSPLSVSCCSRACLLSGDTAASAAGTPAVPALSQPTCPSSARCTTAGTAKALHINPTTSTATPGCGQIVVCVFGSLRFFFFNLKNHLSCYATRQKSLRLW